MAIDTRDKRASAIAATLAPLTVAFQPDGTIGALDRQHVGGFIYRGVATGAPAGGASILALDRGRFRRVFGRVFGRVN